MQTPECGAVSQEQEDKELLRAGSHRILFSIQANRSLSNNTRSLINGQYIYVSVERILFCVAECLMDKN